MGYWINHHIRAEGSKESIEALASKLTQRRPKDLNDDKDIIWSEEEFSFYNIISPPEEMLMSGKWWDQEGQDWRHFNWDCYDAPAEEFDMFTPFGSYNSNARVLTIRISTKYDWPVNIFHELIRQYPSLDFSIWSEGEESEAVEIKGANGTSTQKDYPSPNSHADWVQRDELDSCRCTNYDEEDWFADCPKDEPGIYKVQLTYTHYIKADNAELAEEMVVAYDNGFDMPSDVEILKYAIAPKFLTELVKEVPASE
jgi:hypothetical protein